MIDMIDSLLAVIISYPTSASAWNNCFIKNNQEMLQDLADFALQEHPEPSLMVGISRAR